MKLLTRLKILLGLHVGVGIASAVIAMLAIFTGEHAIAGAFVAVISVNTLTFHMWAKKYKGVKIDEKED